MNLYKSVATSPTWTHRSESRLYTRKGDAQRYAKRQASWNPNAIVHIITFELVEVGSEPITKETK